MLPKGWIKSGLNFKINPPLAQQTRASGEACCSRVRLRGEG
jgi:hypothetical protein